MLTHILVPLSNPHINMYFCYHLDGLFILSLCAEGVASPYPLRDNPKTCGQKPWQEQRPLRASAAIDVMVSQETEKGIKISPQEAGPEETPQRQRGTGTPSPAAASGFSWQSAHTAVAATVPAGAGAEQEPALLTPSHATFRRQLCTRRVWAQGQVEL